MRETFNNWKLWLWQFADADLPLYQRIAKYTLRVIYAVFRDLVGGRITLHAMGLVYTTLLSIVPFLALSFSVLKGFGVHNQMRPALESILLDPLGESAAPIIDSILLFVDNIEVGVLGSVGLGFLIYTVIALVQKVERSFNEIWHVSQTRSLSQRFSNYLSVIMIGPLLVFAALGATAAVVGSEVFAQTSSVEAFSWLFKTVGKLVPYLMIIGLFSFLYVLIPNTRVRLAPALIGGIVAGITWQSLGFGFTLFVASSTNYTAIYSGFAIGIFLLIWLYLVWLVLLVGASVAFHSQHVRQIVLGDEEPSAALDELIGLTIVYRVATNFAAGAAPTINDVESGLSTGPDIVRRMIDKLIANDIVTIAGNQLVPAQPFEKLSMNTLTQIIRSSSQPLPATLLSQPHVEEILQRITVGINEAVDHRSVSEWISESTREDDEAPT